MNSDLVPLLAPLVWAIVSTVIALLLYKTSEGIFTHGGGEGDTKNRLRLTGSVVIAGCVFFALWKTTNPAVMQTGSEKSQGAQARTFQQIANEATEAQLALGELQACIQQVEQPECDGRISGVSSRIDEIARLTKAELK